MKRLSRVAALAVVLLSVSAPRALSAQGLVPAVLGGTGGAVAGGVVSVAIFTAQARFAEEFLYAPDDAVGWQAAPLLIGLGAGVAMGTTNAERLERTAIGAGLGMLGGAAVGALLGEVLWEPPEGKWAGGVIGGGAGLLIGAVIAGVTHDDRRKRGADGASSLILLRIPVGG